MWAHRLCLKVAFLLTLMAVRSQGEVTYNVLPEYDLCKSEILSGAKPPTVYISAPEISTVIFVNSTNDPSCFILFKTCPSCYLHLEVMNIDFLDCSYNDYQNDDPTECSYQCLDYLGVYDNYYQKRNMVITNSRSPNLFTSESSQMGILGCFGSPVSRNISLRVKLMSKAKVKIFTGRSSESSPQRSFSSPNYSNSYVQNNEVYMYRIQSTVETDIIAVSFDDWILSPTSVFDIQGSNRSTVKGVEYPPYIISNGPSLNLTFNTGSKGAGNYYGYLGFKAVAKFYSGMSDPPIYSTDCGGMISEDGGYILLGKIADGSLKDCIWIIKKKSDYDGVLLSVPRYKIGFTEGLSGILEVRNGLTSDKSPLSPWSSGVTGNAHMSDVGFYVRLRGQFYETELLIFSYAMYKNDCYGPEVNFQCSNNKCILGKLRCDGIDHCGDRSDERTFICNPTNGGSGGSTGSGSSSSVSVSVIVPLVVAVFLVIVVCLIIVFVRRCRRLDNSAFGINPGALAQHESRSHRRRRHNHVQMNLTLTSGDHPPSYDEVIQNTPIGYLNMAFSLTQVEGSLDPGLAQPPSYEESMSPTSTAATSQSTPATATSTTLLSRSNNILLHSTTNLSTPQHHGAGVTRATLLASLDPGAYVSSSSSSSGGASDHDNNLNTSSDSSTDVENDLFPTGVVNTAGRLAGPNIMSKNDIQVSVGPKSRNSIAKLESDESCVELSSLAITKEKNEINRAISKSMNHLDHLERDSKSVTLPSAKPEESVGTGDNRGSQSVSREGMYVKKPQQKNMAKHMDSAMPRGISDSSRSRSCVDLSLGGTAGGRLADEDKRFSYAGYGDVSLQKGNFEPYSLGRGLVRDRPVENLNKHSAVSCDDLLEGYGDGKYASRKKQNHPSGQYSQKPYASASSLSRLSDDGASPQSVREDSSGCRPKMHNTGENCGAYYREDKSTVNNARSEQNQHTSSSPQHQYPHHQGRAWQPEAPNSNEDQRQSDKSLDKYTTNEHRSRMQSTGHQNAKPEQLRINTHYRRPENQAAIYRSHQKEGQNSSQHDQQKDNRSLTNDGRLIHPEPIYQTPKPNSEYLDRSPLKQDNTERVHLAHKPHQKEHIYQTPRQGSDLVNTAGRRQPEPIYQNPHPSPEKTGATSDRGINSDRGRSVPRKPIPAPRQGNSKTARPADTERPVPIARSNRRKPETNSSPHELTSLTSLSDLHVANGSRQSSEMRPASVHVTRSRERQPAHLSQASEEENARRDNTVLTLDPNVFNSSDKDVFV